MVARPLGSVGRTARPKRRARNSPYRGDRYRVFDRLEGQLSPRRAGVRLLGSGNRSGRHHPWVSDLQNASSLLIMGSNETPLLGKPVLPTSSCFLVRLTGGRFFVPA